MLIQNVLVIRDNILLERYQSFMNSFMEATNSIEQILFSESKSCSASQIFPFLSWNLRPCYHVDVIPPLVPIMNKMNPVHNIASYLFTIHFNVFCLFMPISSKWYLSFKFLTKMLCAFLISTVHAYLIIFYLVTLLIFTCILIH